ncbi:oxysterol-binding protein-related protein 1C-like, partial [Ananas comosus]|uniref:Oxysterol-binding protein-related protein 1C-like n=1 Tax=Ananas comosus TaxID=4615 RepID=A0A6P5ENI0_ANACO
LILTNNNCNSRLVAVVVTQRRDIIHPHPCLPALTLNPTQNRIKKPSPIPAATSTVPLLSPATALTHSLLGVTTCARSRPDSPAIRSHLSPPIPFPFPLPLPLPLPLRFRFPLPISLLFFSFPPSFLLFDASLLLRHPPHRHHNGRRLTEFSASLRSGSFHDLGGLVGGPLHLHHHNHLHGDVKLNEIVGGGISGILHKWVNYGKGWRPRWFVLQDGVLSYYKIHGPDRIDVNRETEKGSKVIGEESVRRLSRPRDGNAHALARNPIGEVHLKVSSIRESRSDDKRFSIFTGTKRLHLRAETRDDRASWMEALQAVKEMFPRMSNSELMAPVDAAAVSTERLRQRLLQEGVSESALQDCEQIMRSEFAALQNQLMVLKQKQALLLETLRQLECQARDA